MKHFVIKTLGQAKRLVIIVIGFTILVIPVGLAILATEFIWARKLLTIVKERIARLRKGNGCQSKA